MARQLETVKGRQNLVYTYPNFLRRPPLRARLGMSVSQEERNQPSHKATRDYRKLSIPDRKLTQRNQYLKLHSSHGKLFPHNHNQDNCLNRLLSQGPPIVDFPAYHVDTSEVHQVLKLRSTSSPPEAGLPSSPDWRCLVEASPFQRKSLSLS